MIVNKCCLVIFWGFLKMSFPDNMNIDVGGVIFHEKIELPVSKKKTQSNVQDFIHNLRLLQCCSLWLMVGFFPRCGGPWWVTMWT